jgi:hypothetical protein
MYKLRRHAGELKDTCFNPRIWGVGCRHQAREQHQVVLCLRGWKQRTRVPRRAYKARRSVRKRGGHDDGGDKYILCWCYMMELVI